MKVDWFVVYLRANVTHKLVNIQYFIHKYVNLNSFLIHKSNINNL